MADTKRNSTNAVTTVQHTQVVSEQARGFDFHALVRALELLSPEKQPVGQGSHPDKEVARFRHHISQAFLGQDVSAVKISNDADIPHLVEQNFLGMAGSNGPLPDVYTQKVLQEMSQHNFASRDFLDIFNHRVVSILHRVRVSYWVGVSSAFPEKVLSE